MGKEEEEKKEFYEEPCSVCGKNTAKYEVVSDSAKFAIVLKMIDGKSCEVGYEFLLDHEDCYEYCCEKCYNKREYELKTDEKFF